MLKGLIRIRLLIGLVSFKRKSAVPWDLQSLVGIPWKTEVRKMANSAHHVDHTLCPAENPTDTGICTLRHVYFRVCILFQYTYAVVIRVGILTEYTNSDTCRVGISDQYTYSDNDTVGIFV